MERIRLLANHRRLSAHRLERSEPPCSAEPARRARCCNSPQMNAPEAYIQFPPGLITDDGEITVGSTKEFLCNYMSEFAMFITRVLQVVPRDT